MNHAMRSGGVPVAAMLALAGCTLGCRSKPEARASAEATAAVIAPARHTASVYAGTRSLDFAAQSAWFDRNFIDAYRRVGRRDPGWDAEAEALMVASAPALFAWNSAGNAAEEAATRVDRVLRAGCTDPAVLYLAARARFLEDKDSQDAGELFERAVAGMREVPYPRAVARLAASGLRWHYAERDEGLGKRDALAPIELRWFNESLTDGSYGPDDDGVLTHHLFIGTLFDRNRIAMVQSLEATPWVDSWVRLLFRGDRYVTDAWTSRGTTFADKVTEEGWAGFKESLREARKALTESWKLRPDRPEAAAEMVSVAMAQPVRGETPRVWFDRTMAARADYMPAFDWLLNSLRWRWSGDRNALWAFARECAATRRFDTQVPFVAFRAVEQMEQDALGEWRHGVKPGATPPGPRPRSPYRDDAVYRLVTTVLDRYARDPATGVHAPRYASLKAAVAYKAGRYDEALEALQDVGGALHKEARDSVGESLLEARIAAYAGETGARTKRAEELYQVGRLKEALEGFEKARSAASAQAARYLDQRIAASSTERDLAAGQTVAFLPGPDLVGWTPQIGEWSLDPSGTLMGSSSARGLMITSDARVGPDFELEADVELVSTTNQQFQAGVVFGHNPRFWSRDWSSFRIFKSGPVRGFAYFSQNFYSPPRTLTRAVQARNHVLVRSSSGKLTAMLNGEPVVSEYVPEWTVPRTRDSQVGFGSYINENKYTLRYSNARLRIVRGAEK